MMRIIAGILVLLLSACAHHTPPQNTTLDAPSAFRAHQKSLLEQNHWKVRGHILIQTPEKSQRVRVHWQQEGMHTHLSLMSHFGSHKSELIINPEGIEWISGNTRQHPSDLAHWMATQGWPIPMKEALSWLRGLPSQQATHMVWYTDGTLQQLEESGWQIHYSDYRDEMPRYPQKILLTKETLKVTISFQDWE
jgi:outer membrane lipoprotein LolB